MERPDREPDVIFNVYHFWFPERVEYDTRTDMLLKLEIIDGLVYSGGTTEQHKLFPSYQEKYHLYLLNKQIDNILLGEKYE